MRTPLNRARTGPGRLVLTVGATLALAGGSLSVSTLSGWAAASAAPAHPAAGKSAVVVKQATRHPFGKILVTVQGAALYYIPNGSCTGQCLAVWPRLVMPAGKTVPKGARCLGTAKFGPHHRLQVTYRKERLYTFVDDSGGSVTGNDFQGFKVAKVRRSC